MTVAYDLTSPAHLRDPGVMTDRLRAKGPLVRVRFPIIGRVWLATTQEMAGHILKDNAGFGMRRAGGGIAGLQWWMPGIFRVLARNMLTMDEPDHTRLRAIVDEAFRRRAVMDMVPQVRAIADRLAGSLFDDGAPADLVSRYARQLPLIVICELLGLPDEDRVQFAGWANRFTDVTSLPGFLRLVPALYAMRRYIERRLDDARARGGADGLIGELVRVEREGAQISRDETVAMVFLLLAAGHETTTHLISGSVHELLRNQSLRDWLAEDWSRAPLAVEEFLRFVAPVQFSKPRFARRDVMLGGVQLKAGDMVMAMLVAANRDPAERTSPHELDLARRPNRHIAFGTGIHFCLGHQLARIEGACALEALFTRWPKLALAVPEAEIQWRRQPGIRAIRALPVVSGVY
ncbi:MAG: cytochrome P450 [Hyphomicrobiaceae bacterium]|nr:cytochrome P450 [Hyphomicrobiaceae bacterium]